MSLYHTIWTSLVQVQQNVVLLFKDLPIKLAAVCLNEGAKGHVTSDTICQLIREGGLKLTAATCIARFTCGIYACK